MKLLRKRYIPNEIIDISEELTMGLAKIVVLGNQECLIENYKGILEYNEEGQLCHVSG